MSGCPRCQRCPRAALTGNALQGLELGLLSTLSTQTVIENGTAASTISNLADPAIPYYSADGKLYHKSVVDAGTNNSVTTVYLLRAGW